MNVQNIPAETTEHALIQMETICVCVIQDGLQKTAQKVFKKLH